MEMEARIAEVEQQALQWRQEAHASSALLEKAKRRAAELSGKLNACTDTNTTIVSRVNARTTHECSSSRWRIKGAAPAS